jgi:pyruvate/2-oxoglutarate dehydrogenase complex dihydrolipoamide dehydrogenase (E3) component
MMAMIQVVSITYRMAKLRTADVLRTRTVSEPRGFWKMLIGANNDDILGFTACGFEASEPMAVVQTAMIGHMPYPMLREALFTHPTMSEGLIGLLALMGGRKG